MTDFKISAITGKIAGDTAKPVPKARRTLLDRVSERMVGNVSSKQEQDKQLLIIRLLLAVALPIVLILATVEFITTKNVNPLLTVVGTGIMTVLATLLKTNGPDDKPRG